MKDIIVWTVINIVVNLVIVAIVATLFKKGVNLGWKEVGFSVKQIRQWRSLRPYYVMNIYYKAEAYLLVISKKDYMELRKNGTGKTYVYIREFPAWFLNPNFEKYDFSLWEVDWHERDRKSCLKTFLFIFIVLEALIFMFALEVQ